MCVFCFKQKTAYEMRSSDWSSDVCSSDHIRHQEPADVAGDPARRLGVERLVPATCSPLEGPGDEQVAVGRVVGIRHRRFRTGLVPPGVQPGSLPAEPGIRPGPDPLERFEVVECDGEEHAETLVLGVGGPTIGKTDDETGGKKE